MKLSFKWMVMVMVIAIVAIIITGVIMFYHPTTQLPEPVSIDTADQPMMGNPNAKLHFVVFEDLKCFNCMRYNMTIFPTIQKQYIDTGKAKYTFINLAFISGSIPAANAARCVYAQNKKLFFEYVNTIYNNQPPEDQDWATIPNLVNYAKNIPGIDQQKLSECIYSNFYTDFIINNLTLATTVMKGTVATPALYINGYAVQPLTIDRINEIAKAVEK